MFTKQEQRSWIKIEVISCVIIFVQHSGESDDTCWQRTPSSFMTMQGLILLTLSRISFAAGDYDIFAKMKKPLRGTRYNTREEIIRAVGRPLLDINRSGRADGVRRLPQIWQKVVHMGGDYIEGM
jgi:hypothetical protein